MNKLADSVIARPVITVMPGRGRDAFIGLEITYEHEDQIDGLLQKLEAQARTAAAQEGLDWDSPAIFMLGIVMPCGNRTLFRRAIDIPRHDTRCACGDPGHHVVLYKARVDVRQPVWP